MAKKERKKNDAHFIPYTGSTRDILTFFLKPKHLHTFILVLSLFGFQREQEPAGVPQETNLQSHGTSGQRHIVCMSQPHYS